MIDDVLHKNLILHPKASSSVLARVINAARDSLHVSTADKRLKCCVVVALYRSKHRSV